MIAGIEFIQANLFIISADRYPGIFDHKIIGVVTFHFIQRNDKGTVHSQESPNWQQVFHGTDLLLGYMRVFFRNHFDIILIAFNPQDIFRI